MEDNYSPEDDEVFFGSLNDAEITKRRRFLGSNYSSPVTPRPPRFNQASSGVQEGLPDVLDSSTPAQRQLSATNENKQRSTPHHYSLDDSLSNVIILDDSGNSNSVITLSDDESFMRNEELCSNKSTGARNPSESMEIESGSICMVPNNSDAADISNSHNETSSYGKDLVSHSFTAKQNSENMISLDEKFDSEIHIESTTAPVIEPHYESSSSGTDFNSNPVAEDKSIHDSSIKNLENGKVLNDNSSLNYTDTDILYTSQLCDLKSSKENISSSLIQDIDEFVGDSNIHEQSTGTFNQVKVGTTIPNSPQSVNISGYSSSGDKASGISSLTASEFLSTEPSESQKSVNSESIVSDRESGKHGNHSLDVSGLTNFEFSLNGVTDSILDISHGSSLPSPLDTHQSASLKPNQYEEISCDGEQLGNISDYHSFSEKYQEDLHMSVDEVDFRQKGFSDNFVVSSRSINNSNNISEPSEFKSYPSTYSSYSTAYDKTYGENNSTGQSDSFQNYRDVSTDLESFNDADKFSIKSNEENGNEANFEMVMQNRQNSFNGTPASCENSKEGGKSKVTSKLPVFHRSKSLLRPPKFHVKPDTLETSSYKFAKQISKPGIEMKSPKPEMCKIPGLSTKNKQVKSPVVKSPVVSSEKEKPFTTTSNQINTPKHTNPTPKKYPLFTKSKIPSHSYLSLSKTPAKNNLDITSAKNIVKSAAKAGSRTPAQKTSAIPRAAQSDSKVNTLTIPLKDNTNGLSAGKSIPSKNKYQNIISPIQAYIRASTPVSQRKAKIISEEKKSPEMQQTKAQNVSSGLKTPRALQKLKFENGQENVNPNVKEPTRDTLPCRILEPSLEVFWKEEQPQLRLPKMGDKQT